MIIAGEASGDLHGASLMREIKGIMPETKIFGIGGDKMEAEGMKVAFHIKDLAFLGFTEVVKHLPFILKVRKRLLELIANEGIEKIVLIDYPGFNLNFGAKAKKLGLKVIYYISPQIWAWGKNRIKKIKNIVDEMIVVFPFEKDFYSSHGLTVSYVGHPLIERIINHEFIPREKLFDKFDLDKNKEILLLMPGSRSNEIRRIFPEVIKAASNLSAEFNLQNVVACSNNIDENVFNVYLKNHEFKIIKDYTYDLMKHSYFGIIKSGTSTLEASLLSLPFAVVYKTSSLTHAIGKKLINLNSIAMPNIIAGEKVVQEFLQHDVNETTLFEGCRNILSNKNELITMKNKFRLIMEKLGEPGASRRAAEIVCN